jgi:PD-(D/E)XK nuclease superfamily
MKRTRLIHEKVTRSVIGAFYEVYNTLGYGFLEHI